MDYGFEPAEEEFRRNLRSLIREHMGLDFRSIFVDDIEAYESTRRFCEMLADAGLLALSWPKEHGGADDSIWKQTILSEEMLAHREPRGPQYMNLNWVGPAIMHYGTSEQQEFHLPRIVAGSVIWCQGFSEPDSGSDLASLRTRAVWDGTSFRVTGQKVWTSYADLADYCFLATRTSDEPRKQQGLTVFLVPMERAGIEVRPIKTMLGAHHLNEVFLNDVEVSASEILGEAGRGWDVMTSGLSFERTGGPRYAVASRWLQELWYEYGLSPRFSGSVKARFFRSLVRARAAQLLAYRVVSIYEDGSTPTIEGQLARIAGTTLFQEVADLKLDILGVNGLNSDHSSAQVGDGNAAHDWGWAQAGTVTAGTLEIQKMLVARHTLGNR
jgi:alkylation response protein AidB-like acyl-CoA dehydrogenase